MSNRVRLAGILATAGLAGLLAGQQGARYGIVGRAAPGWGNLRWQQLPKGKTSLSLSELRGKVVYVYCFQAFCPNCKTHGFPLLKRMRERFAKHDDVAFVAIQTVFEGFDHNTLDAGVALAKRFVTDVPIGFDDGSRGQAAGAGSEQRRGRSKRAARMSRIVREWRTGGTPWTVLIDRNGVVRFNAYSSRIKDDDVARAISVLRREKGFVGQDFGWTYDGPAARKSSDAARKSNDAARKSSDAARAGLRAVGTKHDFAKHRLTLVRWWTNACPFCRDSLPALAALERRFGKRGFAVLAIYHPKPPRDVASDDVRMFARHIGYDGAIAVDRDWNKLRDLQARGAPRLATSISVLVDRAGRIVWVHPGPRLHPKRRGRYDDADAAHRELVGLLEKRLPKSSASKGASKDQEPRRRNPK